MRDKNVTKIVPKSTFKSILIEDFGTFRRTVEIFKSNLVMKLLF